MKNVSTTTKEVTNEKDYSTVLVLGLLGIIALTVLVLNHFGYINDSFFTI